MLIIDTSVLAKKINFLQNNFHKMLEKDMNKASAKLLKNTERRFSSNFSGGGEVLNAIRNSGINVKQSADGETTLLIADPDKLDQATQLEPTKSQGKVYHLWRILHEGWGMRATAGNKSVFGSQSKRTSPYPLVVIVQSTILEPDYGPGRHPPYLDLLFMAKSNPGVIVVKHRGSAGHQWFLKNAELFDEDFSLLKSEVNRSLNRIFKRAGF